MGKRESRGKNIRVAKDSLPQEPGEIMEIDTLDIRSLPRKAYQQFLGSYLVFRLALVSFYRGIPGGVSEKEWTEEWSQVLGLPFSCSRLGNMEERWEAF